MHAVCAEGCLVCSTPTPPLTLNPNPLPPLQVTGWTKKLPQYLPWLKRSSPYYNLISDESQVWQGEQRDAQGCPAAGGCSLGMPHEQLKGTQLLLDARLLPHTNQQHPCSPHLFSAELNMAYSQHEIVSDFVRPTLMWLEARGKANLTALVNQYSLNQNIGALVHAQSAAIGLGDRCLGGVSAPQSAQPQ